eukprot:Blabericola_migrator_1__1317@NODE_1342_length_4760_cov_176_142340_g900_i0_p1_GENE_NODE_1342_length_4760_cov_176_142340_g900_i0NODE_1342_length_4760_cov_176_142340_g900_i0_p1_ORF_typecomplete_len376_score52_46Torus/PF16131_5/1_7e04Torus/PF16131_5/5_1e28Torus/PF16131_5/8_3e03RRM_1/PF00076_22/1_2e05WW/PF00397_26/3_1e05WW/PF00397_26/7_6e03RRM_5/PF13893_6/9_5e02RRM_5/PF13893_6/0_029Nup35_RRM_2/PF14605_6/0_014Nup35_RRM_2/PF14605_6/7_5e03zfCCCH_3/PF15663_5/0_033MHC_II_alpha/PF00993_20/0_27zfCCCH_4/PF18
MPLVEEPINVKKRPRDNDDDAQDGVVKDKYNPRHQWKEFFDTLSGKPYYSNLLTKETVWELPEGHSVATSDAVLTAIEVDEYAVTLAEREAVAAQAAKAKERAEKRAATSAVDLLTNTPMRQLPMPRKFASLPDKIRVFIRHDQPPTAEEMGRPARVQAKAEELKKTSYVQGQEDFNIWYGKYASDRFGENGRKERVPAATHCNLFRDAGFTKADLSPHLAGNPICIYFAKGCCTLGHECSYYHHVPTFAENERLDMMHDIFGRERHAQHRDDLEGVGSFNSSGRTLFVGDWKAEQQIEKMEETITEHFCIYGPLEEVRVLPNRNVAFVTFCYRAAAEFAKVAMAGYKLDDPDDVLTVKWAQGRRPQGGSQGPAL